MANLLIYSSIRVKTFLLRPCRLMLAFNYVKKNTLLYFNFTSTLILIVFFNNFYEHNIFTNIIYYTHPTYFVINKIWFWANEYNLSTCAFTFDKFFQLSNCVGKYYVHNNYQKILLKSMLMKNLIIIYKFSTKIAFS